MLGPDFTDPVAISYPHDVRGDMYADALQIFGQTKASRVIDSAAQAKYIY
jgi:hypothetical protein